MTWKNGLSKRSLLNLIGIKSITFPSYTQHWANFWSGKCCLVAFGVWTTFTWRKEKKSGKRCLNLFPKEKIIFELVLQKGFLRKSSKLFKILDKRMNGGKWACTLNNKYVHVQHEKWVKRCHLFCFNLERCHNHISCNPQMLAKRHFKRLP